MNPEQFSEFYEKYFYYLIAGGLVFGAIIGLIPLLLGIRHGKRNLGILALVITIIDSGISPLLGLITCVIFTVIIVLIKKPQPDSENAVNASVNNSQAS